MAWLVAMLGRAEDSRPVSLDLARFNVTLDTFFRLVSGIPSFTASAKCKGSNETTNVITTRDKKTLDVPLTYY